MRREYPFVITVNAAANNIINENTVKELNVIFLIFHKYKMAEMIQNDKYNKVLETSFSPTLRSPIAPKSNPKAGPNNTEMPKPAITMRFLSHVTSLNLTKRLNNKSAP